MNDKKKIITALVSLLVIAGTWSWIYFGHIKSPKTVERLHREVGRVLANETAKLLNGKGEIVVVTIDSPRSPELKFQLETFEQTLATNGSIKINKTDFLETKDQPKYRTGGGLSANRFLRIMKKAEAGKAAAVVSLVGAPHLSDDEMAQLSDQRPKFIAESMTTDKLQPLLEKDILQLAIVGRFEFPAPVRKPKTPQQWFENRYQIVTGKAAQLPADQ